MTKKLKHPRAKAPGIKELVDLVFQTASEMEEPLNEAFHLTCLISQVECKESEEMAGIAFAAVKTRAHLSATMKSLRGLFAICKGYS